MVLKDKGEKQDGQTNMKNIKEKKTSMMFKIEFNREGTALLAMYASASTDKSSNRTSIFGSSIPTL